MHELYQAYMIRFSRSKQDAPWRVLLRSADHETTMHFATERELFLYLMARLAAQNVATDADIEEPKIES